MESLTPPPMKKKASSARERLLVTAHRLFYQDGIRATGIDRIISEAQVTKVTFYRHFPSKNDLIRAYLDYRHELWLAWFRDALSRHGGNLAALEPTLAEWFEQEGFRGCAFINSLSELGGEFPDIVAVTRRHKHDMTGIIEGLLTQSHKNEQQLAEVIALIVDGAIIRAQYEPNPRDAMQAVRHAIAALMEKAL
jgi:AcrR family transcriptional regulator